MSNKSSPAAKRGRWSALRRGAVLVSIGLALVAAGLAAGLFARSWIDPADFLVKVERRLDEMAEARNDNDTRELDWGRWHIHTMLVPLEVVRVPIGLVDGVENLGGGGLAEIGDSLVIATGHGALATINLKTRNISYLEQRVPMNLEALAASPLWTSPAFNPGVFRVLGLRYIDDPAQDSPKLYVIHHSYDSDCVRVVISRISVTLVDGAPKFGKNWERVHTVKTCLFPSPYREGFEGITSGGGIVQHRPGRFLFGVGDFAIDLIKNPEVRDVAGVFEYDIATGVVRPYSIGHRNPQGLGVDAEAGFGKPSTESLAVTRST
jgi:hypothetical protein